MFFLELKFYAFLNMLFGWVGASGLFGIACLLAWWFVPEVPWLTSKLRTLLFSLGVGALTFAFVYGFAFTSGSNTTIDRVNKQNERAIHEADEASSARRSCVNSGRVWDVKTGKCS